MKIRPHQFIALFLAAVVLPSCSMLTADGRRQAAYARYVSKSSKGRVKQQRIFHSGKPSMPVTVPNEEPGQMTTTTNPEDAGPQAVAQNAP
jgi:hypothetical protein